MKLKLSIEFGVDSNDAMQTPSDLADAVAKAARKLSQWGELEIGDGGKILDINGQSVGFWEIKE